MRKLIIFFLLSYNLTFSQHTEKEVVAYQNNLKEFYLNKETSPLKQDELALFQGVQFYPFSEKYIVTAKVEYLKNEPVFTMATTGSKEQEYRRYAILHFKLNNKKYQLEVYQNLDLIRNPLYKDHLFLPFLDNTNGVTTNEVGRYLDIKIPAKAKKITLNFNYAYHPYCAYTHGYSCPITPFVNLISIPVEAGVRY